MKLDRNMNDDGSGKYALLKIRAINQLRADHGGKLPGDVFSALEVLGQRGLIHWGNEGPGEQFFVMKYKDKFAAPALFAYAQAVGEEAKAIALKLVETEAGIGDGTSCAADEKGKREQMVNKCRSLNKYRDEIHAEGMASVMHGNRIPD